MEFFVPHAKDKDQAEEVYSGIAKFVSAGVSGRRIWKLKWIHNGTQMLAEVGESLPGYYQTGVEPVLAIFDCGSLYKVCTPNRGGVRGEPVLAGKDSESYVAFFDTETDS